MMNYFFFAMLCLTFSIHGLSASTLDPQKVALEAIQKNLTPPKADPDGRMQTLNNKGSMSPALDQISQAFVNFASTPGIRVLEIGAAYGLACEEALAKGCTSYTANDMDETHLKILARRIHEKTPSHLTHLKLISGEFPNAHITGEYDAILIARVLHFMNPEEVTRTLKAALNLLKPGGKIYAVMLSPYVKGFAPFIPVFEKRIQENHPFPGYVEDLEVYTDRNVVPENKLETLTKEPFLFFNTVTARTLFERAGFEMETCIDMPLAYPSAIWQLDGRENVGVIARKPLL